MSNMNIDRIEDFLSYIIVSPYCLIEKISGLYFTTIFEEDMKKLIFFRREIDSMSGFFYKLGFHIYLKRAKDNGT